MILDTSQNQISKIFKKQEMGIKVDALAHQMMIDGIYSNKLNSVIREISTNARDSHIEANNPNPFEIDIETSRGSNYCSITISDYGVGLSEEDVLMYLCNLNSSSKRDSDTVVGCFGIGSKSVFALTDKYTYDCVKDGVLTSLLLTKDKNGTPNYTHTTSPTDLPNSVVCTFAIKEDCKSVLEAIYVELALFDIKPTITILRDKNLELKTEPFEFNSNSSLFYTPEDFFPVVVEKEHYYLIDQSKVINSFCDYFEHKHLSCGVIGYKLDNYSTTVHYRYSHDSKSGGVGILPKFALGEIKFGVSREIIENTAETFKLLAEKFIDIYRTYPNSKEISDFCKVNTNNRYLNYNGSSYDFRRETSLLLQNYLPQGESPENLAILNNLNSAREFFNKDYLSNKITVSNKRDLMLMESFIYKLNTFFRLFEKIPAGVVLSAATKAGVPLVDIVAFYLSKGVSSNVQMLKYYSSEIDYDGRSKSAVLYDLCTSLLHRMNVKYTSFKGSHTDESERPVYVYSHKSFGSNDFLSSVTFKDINVIKVSRAQELLVVDKAMKLITDLIGIDIVHLDDYKEDHPEFFASLRPKKKVRVVTPGETTASPTTTENGLRLREKHELITLHTKLGWNDSTVVVEKFEGETALTSTQFQTKLNNYLSSNISVIIIDESILDDPKVFETFSSRYVLMLTNEQSDMEEIYKIAKLSNQVFFIDKIHTKESIDAINPDVKVALVEQAMISHTEDLQAAVEALGNDTFTRIMRTVNSRSYHRNLKYFISVMYFNKHDVRFVDFCIENMDKFKVDFFNLEYIEELKSHYKSLIFSEDIVDSIALLKKDIFNDD